MLRSVTVIVISFLFFQLTQHFVRRIPFTTLDKRIVQGLIEPKPKKGHVLLHDLFIYYDQLDEVSRLIEEKSPKGFDLLKRVGKNGPRFLNVTFDLELLYRVYKWCGDDVNELETSLAGNRYMWKYLEAMKLHL